MVQRITRDGIKDGKMRKLRIGLILGLLLALAGCDEERGKYKFRRINECLFDQDCEISKLENRIIDLEYKVKYFRYIEENRIAANLKEAKESLVIPDVNEAYEKGYADGMASAVADVNELEWSVMAEAIDIVDEAINLDEAAKRDYLDDLSVERTERWNMIISQDVQEIRARKQNKEKDCILPERQ